MVSALPGYLTHRFPESVPRFSLDALRSFLEPAAVPALEFKRGREALQSVAARQLRR